MEIITTATSKDVATAPAEIAVWPIGSFEQHGSHLPLATDTLVACGIAEAICDAYGLLLLPPLTISCSHEHSAWPGTVSIRSTTLHAVINDVFASLQRSGTRALVLVNGHGGNYVLSNVVQELTVDYPCAALFPGRDDWLHARQTAGLISDAHEDMHAGEIETSLLLHLHPTAVRDSYVSADFDTKDPRRHLLTVGLANYTASGVVGRPSLATSAKGKAIIDSLVACFSDYLSVLTSPKRYTRSEG